METDLQNTGIGGLLLETTMQLARKAGYRTINLLTLFLLKLAVFP